MKTGVFEMESHPKFFPAINESQMRVLLESTNSIPWVINWTTKEFTYIGPQVERILGYPRETWVDATSWAERIYQEDRDRVVNYCISQTEKGENHYADYRAITSNGNIIWIRDVVHIIREGGATKEIVGFMFDITETKVVEEELATAKKSLELSNAALSKSNEGLTKSNEELENFAFIASHDLNEPLRKINTFGDKLRSTITVSEEKSIFYAKRMQNAAVRMQGMVSNLMKFARINLTKEPFKYTDLRTIVESVLDDLENRIKETNGVVNLNSLPIIEADYFQMNQLFLNLTGNALKFHRDGVPPVININSIKRENGFWDISFEDNGIGIEEKNFDRIFNLFERLHGQSTYEGTGMGLAICNKIVSRHGGKLTVKRNPLNGVTFHITLPDKNSQSNH